jgi:hypothetical protein
MTNCNQSSLEFPALKRRKIQTQFAGGEITSDGGVLLLRQMDRQLGLLESVNTVIPDSRDARYVQHSQLSLLRQRIYGLCLGYEDLNDHDQVRFDPAIQTSVDCDSPLGSAPTLCRLENRADRQMAVGLHEVMVDQFIDSFKQAPRKLILDFDATDDRVHGSQEGRFFHGYYDHYCFLPLYVFCKEQLLVSYLRPSKIDGAKHTWAILSLLVKRLRQVWPKVKIVFRGDSGFCRWRMLRWCERHDVGYIVGIAKNARLNQRIEGLLEAAEQEVAAGLKKARRFSEFDYQADSWDVPRRIIAKIEVTDKGRNPRYVVTNLNGKPRRLYDKLYCARGDMENHIKQQQLDLYADRTSCHAWWANQFRLLMSSMAYILLESIRRIGLTSTELAKAYVGTIRLKLLKIGAVIIQNTRRVQFLLSSNYPYQALFATVAARLSPE